MKDSLVSISIIAGLILVLFVGTTASIYWYRHFGIMRESATTDIYRENKSYVEGTIRDLREMQVKYVEANDSQKEALSSLILHRANELDWDRLPSDVQDFLHSLKGSSR